MRNILDFELDWNKWTNISRCINIFTPIIKEIFNSHDLGVNKIENVAYSTNSVFKVDNYIIKMYVPLKIVNWKSNGYEEELRFIYHGRRVGLKTPNVIAHGTYHDLYNLNYIIYEYLKGKEARHVLKDADNSIKVKIAKEIKRILNCLNKKYIGKCDNSFVKERLLDLERWGDFSSKIKKQYLDILSRINFNNCYYVHGDINASNVIINEKKEIFIIDYADACFAPKYYEYPSVIFKLFSLDKLMVEAFLEGEKKEQFCNELFLGLIIHDFGGDIVKDLYRHKGLNIADIRDIYEIKDLIVSIII